MLDFFVSFVWFVVWAVTLLCSIATAIFVIRDEPFDEYPWGPWVFFATPILWALIIVFYFN